VLATIFRREISIRTFRHIVATRFRALAQHRGKLARARGSGGGSASVRGMRYPPSTRAPHRSPTHFGSATLRARRSPPLLRFRCRTEAHACPRRTIGPSDSHEQTCEWQGPSASGAAAAARRRSASDVSSRSIEIQLVVTSWWRTAHAGMLLCLCTRVQGDLVVAGRAAPRVGEVA
jgi:hypothetical protein